MEIIRKRPDLLLWLVFGQALLGMVGSLYFSDIVGFPPCKLCWYQRIFLYPLVPISLVGIYLKDTRVAWYGIPLSIIGAIIALYHNIKYYIDQALYGAEGAALLDCGGGISCSQTQLDVFGFVTIPLLSLTAFIVISALLLWHYRLTFKD